MHNTSFFDKLKDVKKQIVILGAGFGGVKAAFSLCNKLKELNLMDKYQLFLVDKNLYHTYTPTLYEAATTSKDTASQIQLERIVTFRLKDIFKGKNITLLQKIVKEIDLLDGDVHFQEGEKLKFDYLVLALGSEINYFGIPGLKENALPLKTFIDAIKARDVIWNEVDNYSLGKEIKVIVGGGGATGVELASEVKSWLCQLEEELRKCQTSVKIIEASQTILFGFDDFAVKKVTKRLKEIGVELFLNEAIVKVDSEKVFLKSGQIIDFDVLIWTGGVKAVNLMATLPLKKEQKGRVEVIGEMECLPQTEDLKLYGKVYGLGDAICFYDPETNRPIPQLAEAAIEQAKVVAHNIIEDIKIAEGLSKRVDYKKYFPKKYSYIIPVGGKYAVAKVGPIIVWGFLGWILKGVVEFYYLLFNVLPPLQAFKVWLKGLRIFMQNDRLG